MIYSTLPVCMIHNYFSIPKYEDVMKIHVSMCLTLLFQSRNICIFFTICVFLPPQHFAQLFENSEE